MEYAHAQCSNETCALFYFSYCTMIVKLLYNYYAYNSIVNGSWQTYPSHGTHRLVSCRWPGTGRNRWWGVHYACQKLAVLDLWIQQHNRTIGIYKTWKDTESLKEALWIWVAIYTYESEHLPCSGIASKAECGSRHTNLHKILTYFEVVWS